MAVAWLPILSSSSSSTSTTTTTPTTNTTTASFSITSTNPSTTPQITTDPSPGLVANTACVPAMCCYAAADLLLQSCRRHIQLHFRCNLKLEFGYLRGPVSCLRECIAPLMPALSATCANVSLLCCRPRRLLARMFRRFVAGPAGYLRERFAALLLALPATCLNVSHKDGSWARWFPFAKADAQIAVGFLLQLRFYFGFGMLCRAGPQFRV